jgi:hypothetical protein
MKKAFTFLFVLPFLLACESESKLTFETIQLDNSSCDDCPQIKITIPKALDDTRIAERINTTINEELIYTLKFEDSLDVATVEEAMQSFTNSYKNFKKEFTDEAIGWEAQADGVVSYENPFMLSLQLDTYIFTGGAHGYGATTFLNFDKGKSIELENYRLFKDLEGFIDFAETQFREAQKVPNNGLINATGFMFSGNVFHLPENLGFTKDGIKLIYNQYEVASYADGPIELLIPFAAANPFLKDKYKVNED